MSSISHDHASNAPPLIHFTPGLLASVALAGGAWMLAQVQVAVFGQAWISSLIIALVIGALLRLAIGLPVSWQPGVTFSAKTLLEAAIVLIGASLNLTVMGQSELVLLFGVTVFVMAAIAIGYGIGRALGLSPRLSALVACGNAICGNSAILAAAPSLRAHDRDIAAALAFTAVLGLGTVLMLPLVYMALAMTDLRYGILSGLVVYAVPQVLAATSVAGPTAVQIGATVKLMRVLMLGPVVVLFGVLCGRGETGSTRPHLVPAFITGFAALAIARALGLIPEALLTPMATTAETLSLIAMAGLGLLVNLRDVGHAGGRVLAAGILSVAALVLMSGILLFALDLGGAIG